MVYSNYTAADHPSEGHGARDTPGFSLSSHGMSLFTTVTLRITGEVMEQIGQQARLRTVITAKATEIDCIP